jgi:hypothetical protein
MSFPWHEAVWATPRHQRSVSAADAALLGEVVQRALFWWA